MPASLLDDAIVAARAGGDVLMRYYRQGGLEARAKAANDFVTAADHASEAAVVAVLRGRHPEHAILAEEGGATAGGGDYEWVIDPLDGTSNFMQGLKFFCVSVACRKGGELLAGVVFDPLSGDLFTASKGGGAFRNGEPIIASARPGLAGAFLATGYPYRAHAALEVYLAAFREVFLESRGIRRCGAAALDLAYTACGTFDGFFEYALSPWDVAAGALLITEAGGLVSDLDGGQRHVTNGNVVAGGRFVQPELLRRVAQHGGEAVVRRLTRPGEDPA